MHCNCILTRLSFAQIFNCQRAWSSTQAATTKIYVDGKAIESKSNEWIDLHNPATNEVRSPKSVQSCGPEKWKNKPIAHIVSIALKSTLYSSISFNRNFHRCLSIIFRNGKYGRIGAIKASPLYNPEPSTWLTVTIIKIIIINITNDLCLF